MIGMRVTGFEATLSGLEDMKKSEQRRLESAADKCSQIVFHRSQVLVPVDTTALKKSGKREKKRGPGGAPMWEISYGGPTAPYALWVHEDLSKHHAPPTQAKYVSQAVDDTRVVQEAMIQREFDVTYTDYDRRV